MRNEPLLEVLRDTGTAHERARELGAELSRRCVAWLEAVKVGEEDPLLIHLLGEEVAETARRTAWSTLVLNPGSTSTKLALYSGVKLIATEDVGLRPGRPDGVEERVQLTLDWFERLGLALTDLSGIAARGGFVAPVPPGTYRVCEEMVADLARAPHRHASNMAIPMALRLGELAGPDVEVTITDPVTSDEVATVRRLTGSARIRADGAAVHSLNLRSVFTLIAHLLDTPLSDTHVIGCHMGGGMSALRCFQGRTEQALVAFGNLPSANRAGALPLKEVLERVASREYTLEDLRHEVVESGGGLRALAGTDDFKALAELRAETSDAQKKSKIDLILEFFANQVAAGISQLSATPSPVEAVVLTGGLARDRDFCAAVEQRVHLGVPVIRVPGSLEAQALAAGLLRTFARSPDAANYVAARDALARRRDEEDELLDTVLFDQTPRPAVRRRQLKTLDGVMAAASPSAEATPMVAIVGADNEEALLAAKLATSAVPRALARFALVGSYARINELAWELDLPIDNEQYLVVDAADPVARGMALLEAGLVATLMKGSVTTAELLKGYFQYLKRRGLAGPGRKLSHVSLVEIPGRHRILGLTDAAINPSPTVEERVEILANAIEVFRALGIDSPKVAVLSATEKASDKVRSSVEAREIVERTRGRFNAVVEGPLSVDLALAPGAAEEKHYTGAIRGDADILLAPNLDVANAVYKAFTVTTNANVAGVVVGGDVPLILTSRGDHEKTKLSSIAFALLLTQRRKEAGAR